MHKEKISALMDGEMPDTAVLHHLAQDESLQQTWQRYHLVRDLLRGDMGEVLHVDIASRVMAAVASEPRTSVQGGVSAVDVAGISHTTRCQVTLASADTDHADKVNGDARHNEDASNEDVSNVVPLIIEAQPDARQWRQMPWWSKLRPLAGQISQVAVAACVSLAVIMGVQHYHHASDAPASAEPPVFNTLPMMGSASPVSFGVPANSVPDNQQQWAQEQHRRISALLQDYELQRRLHAEQLKQESAKQASQQAPAAPESSLSASQPAGTQIQ